MRAHPTTTYEPAGTFQEHSAKLRWYLMLLGLATALALASAAWAANLTVTTTADELDNIIANGTCSLREAVISAHENHDVGGCTNTGQAYDIDTITLPAGTYTIDRWTISLVIDQDAGNLNVFGNLTINGAGSNTTVIQGPTHHGDQGGGLIKVEEGADLTLTNLTLRDGLALQFGGVIWNRGNLRLENVVVADGWANDGGGIFSSTNTSLTLIDSTVRDNLASNGNGGGIEINGTATVTNSTISGNEAESDGGGIWNFGDTTITNSTISGNQADGSGGGIYNILNTPFLSLESVTISDNTADADQNDSGQGGGLFTNEQNTDEIEVGNSLIAGNTDASPGSEHPDCSGTFTSLDHNLIGDGSGCFGFNESADQVGTSVSPIDPPTGPLLSNGGLTKTHALQLISPAVDAGPDSCEATDQRGFAHPNDGDGSTTAECDIGAYEAPEGELQEADLSLTLTAPTVVELSEEFTLETVCSTPGPAPPRTS